MSKVNKVRKNVQLSEDMAEYVEKQCEAFGVTQSGFINICIKQYRDQATMLHEMTKFQSYFDKLERLAEKIDTKELKND